MRGIAGGSVVASVLGVPGRKWRSEMGNLVIFCGEESRTKEKASSLSTPSLVIEISFSSSSISFYLVLSAKSLLGPPATTFTAP